MDVQGFFHFRDISVMRLATILTILTILAFIVIGFSSFVAFGSENQTSEAAPIPLEVGQLFAPREIAPDARTVDLWIHFHGHSPVVLSNVHDVNPNLVVLIINQPGLSAAYRKPFEDEGLFGRVVDEAFAELRKLKGEQQELAWGKMYVSSFSAGYGAVREILKHDRYVEQIDGYVALDSIYAGLVSEPDGDGERVVEPVHMAPFRRFAQLATEGRRRFVLTHTQLHTPSYASTVETAGDLVDFTGAMTQSIEGETFAPFTVLASQRKGSFEVYSCSGDDGEAHMQHLRDMATWVRRLMELSAR